jgi:23S rRNA (guanosine2251-2'-O)-methyltransferase
MPELHVIANDIRSRENVGAIFRTCEFLGVSKLWLTGYTPTPPDPKLLKVSLGAEKAVVWEQAVDVRTALDRLKKDGFRISGLELDQRAVLLSDYDAADRVALLLGNEVTGIPPSLLDRCDDVVMIAKNGKKESLNVAVAAGIAMWSILN